MQNKFVFIAGVFGMAAVVLGAFGAHALKNYLEASQLSAYQTGISYQFYHTLAMFAIALSGSAPTSKTRLAFWLFLVGILLFCGSLYWITLSKAGLIPMLWIIGPITPIGGLFFIAGWSVLAIHGLTKP